jgi:ABC-type sugar transport system ATPase subunit
VTEPIPTSGEQAVPAPAEGEALLVAEQVSKKFPGVVALDRGDFDVRPHEVHALIGENGAGKSTLIKLMAGYYSPDAGEIRILNERLPANPTAAHAAGIQTIHQERQLVPYLSVAENLVLGMWPSTRGVVSRRQMRIAASEALDRIDLRLPLSLPARLLSPAEAQLLDIARALSGNVLVLVMDEPTTSLSAPEIERLFNLVRGLKETGMGIVFVSHWLEEVFAIADRITVLRDGRLVGTAPADELDPRTVVRMMVGEEVFERPLEARPIGEPLLEVQNLSRTGILRDVSFALRAGEVVTISGLVGAGRTELVRCIFGVDGYDSGQVLVGGKPLPRKSPPAAIAAGLGFVPEDRREQGLVELLSVMANLSLGVLDKVAPRRILSRRIERGIASTQIKAMNIKAASPTVRVSTLSGGNQQKVVIGRWLARQPRVLIMDEPTKGIDVGAKAEIHKLIGQLAEAGMAVLMVTSELPEVLLLSDRTLVMRGGRIVGVLDRSEISKESVMSLAAGGVITEEGKAA